MEISQRNERNFAGHVTETEIFNIQYILEVSANVILKNVTYVYNLFIGHVTSYNNCLFHLVIVTLINPYLGYYMKYHLLCFD